MSEATCPPVQSPPQTWSERLAAEAVQDPEALARLYAAHAAQLYRYFWIQTRSEALAEDLVSESFLHVLHSLPDYRPERGAFSAWLYGIARHALARHVKLAARVPAEPAGLAPVTEVQERTALPAVSPDELIDLWRAVAELPEAERDVVALKFGAGLTYPEIGEILALRAGHVGVLLCRALQRLRARLADGEDGDAE